MVRNMGFPKNIGVGVRDKTGMGLAKSVKLFF